MKESRQSDGSEEGPSARYDGRESARDYDSRPRGRRPPRSLDRLESLVALQRLHRLSGVLILRDRRLLQGLGDA